MLLTIDSLSQIERQVHERSQALTRKVEKLEALITAEKDKLEIAERERASRAQSAEERSAIKAIMGTDRSRAIARLRRGLVESSQKERDAILGVFPKFEESISQTSGLYQSPQQVLAREGLGDARRSEIQRQLVGAGPATLRSMADLAVAQNDKVLAAAILAVEDHKSTKKRAIDLAQFAGKLVGSDLAAMQYRLETLRSKIQAMRSVNRAFERGVHSSLDRIEKGLAVRALASKAEAMGYGDSDSR